MLKVCISGLGRTGCQLAKYFINTGQVQLISAICSSKSWKAGYDLGEVIGCANMNVQVVEVVEMHHKHKQDIPSVTATKIANEMKNIRNKVKCDTCDISISSVRAGGIISYHKVMLVGENDMIEIVHQPFSRDAFAEGHFARWNLSLTKQEYMK